METLILIAAALMFLWYLNSNSSNSEATDQEVRDAIAKVQELVHCVEYEQCEDITYWFDVNGKFLAQGHNQEEIIQVLKTRFPRHVFILPEDKLLMGPEWRLVDADQAMVSIDR